MRICYLTHQYLPRHVGGTEVFTHGLATRARRAGHRAHVVTHVEAAGESALRRTVYEGVPVTEIHSSLSDAADPARAEYDNPATAALVESELKETKPDLVHAVHLMRLSGAALAACYRLGVPVVLTLADFWFICPRHTLLRWDERLCGGPVGEFDCVRCLHGDRGLASAAARLLPARLWRRASGAAARALGSLAPPFVRDTRSISARNESLRRLVERADRVVALTQFQKEMYVRNGYRAGRIEVIGHGPETGGLDFAPTAGEGGAPEIVFVGSFVAHKGLHVLLEALRARPSLRVRLALYGDAGGGSPYAESVRRMAAADPRVELKGTFPVGGMGRVLRTASALALPALWYENGPLVVKAARYAGVPVLASDIGTLATSVRHGRDGWLVPAGDVSAWASALEAICAGPPLPRSPDRTIKSMDENAQEIFALYREVIASRRCGAPNTS